MSHQIFLDPRIHKKLDQLRRSDKKAGNAAVKAQDIMVRLQAGSVIPDKVGNITKHGELRIKGVMKYDLGSGYRLVTYKQGDQLFLLHIGTHDDCHRWIENNRELTVEQIKDRCTELPINAINAESESFGSIAFEEEEYDPLANVSQKELREVFSGLVSKSF
jgi:hypothetical protein